MSMTVSSGVSVMSNVKQLINNGKITQDRYKNLSGESRMDLKNEDIVTLILSDKINAEQFLALSGEDRNDLKNKEIAVLILSDKITAEQFLALSGEERLDLKSNAQEIREGKIDVKEYLIQKWLNKWASNDNSEV